MVMPGTATEWAEELNTATANKAVEYGIDLHSAVCDIIDWSVVDSALAGVLIETNTLDSDMGYGEYLSKDGNWVVTWNKSTLTWQGTNVLPYNGWAE